MKLTFFVALAFILLLTGCNNKETRNYKVKTITAVNDGKEVYRSREIIEF
ncbi:hypothetical protein H3N56_02720 [Cetobacterium sp. 2A]|nr:hypothetical protein [Cetobacterium sp. 2A]MBC2855342.1 hypothetical protein [Cetobacterium sp. 2A]MBC2855407.1 hypothetical protein [Cetobacterium sp. 2A]